MNRLEKHLIELCPRHIVLRAALAAGYDGRALMRSDPTEALGEEGSHVLERIESRIYVVVD